MALIYCSECGKQISEYALTCPNCGAPVSIPMQPKSSPSVPKRESSGKATAALILGISSLIAWLFPLFGYPVSIIGIVFGCIAIKQNSQNKQGVVGAWLSAVGFVLTLINSVLGAMMLS